ncbi:unnamed protein product, partial [Brugia timori]
MTETETKVTTAIDEAPYTNSPVAESKLPTSVNSDEDIPAVDADVKDLSTLEPKELEAKEKVPESRKDPREDPIGW